MHCLGALESLVSFGGKLSKEGSVLGLLVQTGKPVCHAPKTGLPVLAGFPNTSFSQFSSISVPRLGVSPFPELE